VTVVAANAAGPPLSVNASSGAVVVDTTGPLPGPVYNTAEFWQAAATTNVRSVAASWGNFTDPQSGVSAYLVQFFALAPSAEDGGVLAPPPGAASPDGLTLTAAGAAAAPPLAGNNASSSNGTSNGTAAAPAAGAARRRAVRGGRDGRQPRRPAHRRRRPADRR
jgi:hypothetical protein